MRRRFTPKEVASKLIRQRIYLYIKASDEEWVSVKSLSEALELTRAQTYHHVVILLEENYLVGRKVAVGKVSNLMLQLSGNEMPKDYTEVETTAPPPSNVPVSHIRTINLLDNPLPKPKESKKSTKVYIGSGMSLFNNY
jgi:hypothetical protein